MLSTTERKKKYSAKALLPSVNAEIKKYDEIYQKFAANGYSKELCEEYADAFISEQKKAAPEDIIQTARLYNHIYDHKSAELYLDMLADKKLSGEDRFEYCTEKLKTISILGRWRDAEDFRTENINFMQNFALRKPPEVLVDLYVALALADCAAKKYNSAFSLLNFGYKPSKITLELLEISITAVYINAKSGDAEGLEGAIANAKSCLKLIHDFEHDWCRTYYSKLIESAAEGII